MIDYYHADGKHYNSTPSSTDMNSFPTISTNNKNNDDERRLIPAAGCDQFRVLRNVLPFQQEQQEQQQQEQHTTTTCCYCSCCTTITTGTTNTTRIIASTTGNDELEFLASHKQSFSHPENQDLIAAELIQLSLQERETILHDIHGVSKCLESPELLKRSLRELDALLSSSKNNNYAYQLALRQNPASVQDIKFRLLFLRSEDFNAAAAAQKLQKFLSVKLQLFGEEKLGRPITLQDLDGNGDMECLRNGHIQVLNRRDTAGRAVIVLASAHIRFQVLENELKNMFYFFTALLEETETQIHGVVMIAVGLPSQNPWTVWKVNQLSSAMPISVRGWHVTHCSWGGRWLQWLSSLLPRQSRLRLRVHDHSNNKSGGGGCGTAHTESINSLMTFGIPASGSDFPIQLVVAVVETNMEECIILSRDNHWRWIETRRELEQHRRRVHFPVAAKESLAAALTISPSDSTDNNGFLPLPPPDSNAKSGKNNALVKQARIPWRPDTINSNGHHHQQEQQIVRSNDVVAIVFCPTSKDVLFGRGRPFQEHAGNIRFSVLLESKQDSYESLRRTDKTALAQDIVLEMKLEGARFLRQAAVAAAAHGEKTVATGTTTSNSTATDSLSAGNGYATGYYCWEEVDDAVAREKVSQAFRSMRSSGKKCSINSSGADSSGGASGRTGRRSSFGATSTMTTESDQIEADATAAVADAVGGSSGGHGSDLAGAKRRTIEEQTGPSLIHFRHSLPMMEQPNFQRCRDDSNGTKRVRKI